MCTIIIELTITSAPRRWSEHYSLTYVLETHRCPEPCRLPEIPLKHILTCPNLDGTGVADISTGIGFFDHMLTLLAKHSLIDLSIKAAGDLHVDAHHTVEDVGICLGKALAEALGNKSGIRRYGSETVPMDEALVTAAVDLSGRAACIWRAEVPVEMLGTFNTPLAEEFWRAVANSGAFNLHILCYHGRNSHHIIEGVFKATARALRLAVEIDPRMPGIPSTKGVL